MLRIGSLLFRPGQCALRIRKVPLQHYTKMKSTADPGRERIVVVDGIERRGSTTY